jgi:flagellar motor component MotA
MESGLNEKNKLGLKFEDLLSIDNVDLQVILNRADTCPETIGAAISGCDENVKTYVLSNMPKFKSNIVKNYINDNLSKDEILSSRTFLINDAIAACDSSIIEISLKGKRYTLNTKFIKETEENIMGFKMKCQENYYSDYRNSLDYSSFVSEYYKLILLFYKCSNKIICKGTLAIEDDIGDIEDKYNILKIALRLIVDGQESEAIEDIVSPYIEKEYDKYWKTLKQMQRDGALELKKQGSYGPSNLMFLLSHFIDNLDEKLEIEREKYLDGDIHAFQKLFEDDSFKKYLFDKYISKEITREEIVLVNKIVNISELWRREGPLAVEIILDKKLIANKDILEYGIMLVLSGKEDKFIEKVLDGIILSRDDMTRQNYYFVQKKAVMCLYNYDSAEIIVKKLLPSFAENIQKIILNEFSENIGV